MSTFRNWRPVLRINVQAPVEPQDQIDVYGARTTVTRPVDMYARVLDSTLVYNTNGDSQFEAYDSFRESLVERLASQSQIVRQQRMGSDRASASYQTIRSMVHLPASLHP